MHQIVKRFALAVVFLVLLIFLGGAGAIYGLNLQIEKLNAMREEKARLAQQIEKRNMELRQIVDRREQVIDRMDMELNHIESLVGIEPSPETDRYERLDTASQTALEKALMLRSIPNGWPLKEPSKITSGYGWRDHPITGERSFHAAIDMRASVGRKVIAAADGVINYAAKHPDSGLGELIIIDHDLGFRTHYAHLSDFKVEQGEFVEKGDVIGLSGATGKVNGPHLHYEIWYLQRKLNPEPFLDWSLRNYDELFAKEGRVKWESLAKGIRQKTQLLERQLSAMGHESSEN